MRVRACVWTPGLWYGGAERWIVELLRHTDPKRIEWIGVGLYNDHARDARIVDAIETVAPVFGGPESMRSLSMYADVIVGWGLQGWWTLVSPLSGARVVWVAHGVQWATAQFFAGSERAERLAVVSRAAAPGIAEHELPRVEVMYNACGAERVTSRIDRASMRRAWGLPEDALVLGMLGRVAPEKHPLALPRTLARLPEWHGVLVGDGSERLSVIQEAQRACPGRLAAPAFTEDVGSAYGAMDALLVASYEEGYSYVLAEAWLAGVPVISTRVGLLTEHPHLARLVSSADDYAGMAEAVRKDQAHPSAREHRRVAARAFAEMELSNENFGERWTTMIEAAARDARRPKH